MKPYVYAVEFREAAIQRTLDLLRLVLNPRTRRRAHLSLRGPYAERLAPDVTDRINERLLNVHIEVVGIGRFHDPSQGTVYLECAKTPELKDVWDKPGLPFTPHVTAFDGPDVEFATTLFETLSKRTLRISASPSMLLEYKIGEYDETRNPRYVIEGEGANELDLDSTSIDSMLPTERIALAEAILTKMKC